MRRGQAAAPRSAPRAEGGRVPRRGRRACPGMADRLASAHWRAQGEGSRRGGVPSPRPLALGRPERGAQVGWARPSVLTPGDPALRRATAAPAQAARTAGGVTVTGCLGRMQGNQALLPLLGGGCALWGVGGHHPPGRGGGGPRAQLAARGGVTEAKCTCVSVC